MLSPRMHSCKACLQPFLVFAGDVSMLVMSNRCFDEVKAKLKNFLHSENLFGY